MSGTAAVTSEATPTLPPDPLRELPDFCRPLVNLPWVSFIERTGVPAFGVGIVLMLLCLPLYDYNSLTPRLPMAGAAFPPALALALSFLLFLARGATSDFRTLVGFGRIGLSDISGLVVSRRGAFLELGLGLVIGVGRLVRQIRLDADTSGVEWLEPGRVLVALSIIGYTVLQVHLLAFCVRQAIVYRRVAHNYHLDLLAPEHNSLVSNPLIRFLIIGLVIVSFGVLVIEFAPYATLQRRVVGAGAIAGVLWLLLLGVSLVPLFVLRWRIAAAKTVEINIVRRALRGDRDGLSASAFGTELTTFSAAELMYYEDRIRAVWEWPFEAHIRRLVIFGLLPPLTWMLAALVEIVFESALAG